MAYWYAAFASSYAEPNAVRYKYKGNLVKIQ